MDTGAGVLGGGGWGLLCCTYALNRHLPKRHQGHGHWGRGFGGWGLLCCTSAIDKFLRVFILLKGMILNIWWYFFLFVVHLIITCCHLAEHFWYYLSASRLSVHLDCLPIFVYQEEGRLFTHFCLSRGKFKGVEELMTGTNGLSVPQEMLC